MSEPAALVVLGAVLLLPYAYALTRVIGKAWFHAKKKHLIEITSYRL